MERRTAGGRVHGWETPRASEIAGQETTTAQDLVAEAEYSANQCIARYEGNRKNHLQSFTYEVYTDPFEVSV